MAAVAWLRGWPQKISDIFPHSYMGGDMRYVVGICWGITGLVALAVGVSFFFSLTGPLDATGKTFVAVVSLLIVAIPYIFTKAIEGIWKA
jgi:hypothetical protein